ncbi:hypothetical protein ECBCE008MS01_0648, partial [Escherichia coli BCE008_MS-01]
LSWITALFLIDTRSYITSKPIAEKRRFFCCIYQLLQRSFDGMIFIKA